MIVNVILAILVLSVIIIVHEFGHFIVAKANGVTVLEFALGFGPKLIHFKKGETVYSIKLLPFGGSCMMLGDEFMEAQTDEDEDEQADEKDGKAKTLEEEYDADRAFSNKSVWSRIAIIAAGPLFNFLLALILSIIMIGVDGYDLCTVDKVYDNSPAQEAGLTEGDTILKINGDKMSCSREYSFYRYYNAAKTMNITYERDGQKYTTQLTPQYTKLSSYKMGVVIEPDCTIQSVTKDSPAEAGRRRHCHGKQHTVYRIFKSVYRGNVIGCGKPQRESGDTCGYTAACRTGKLLYRTGIIRRVCQIISGTDDCLRI